MHGSAGASPSLFQQAAKQLARTNSCRFVRRRHHEAVLLVDNDDVARRELSTSACLKLAVDGDVAILNRELRLATAVDDSSSLEELIERDRSWV